MHNINYIRENPTEFDNLMKLRGEKPLSSKIIEIDKQKRETQTILQSLLGERNTISKTIGIQKKNNKDVSMEMKQIEEIKNKINTLKELENIKENELNAILIRLPNIPHKTVPLGKDENDNKLYKEWGKKPKFNFQPKKHFEIGEELGLINFELASKLSGSRFVVLKKTNIKIRKSNI